MPTHATVLAFDYGLRQIGVAVGNRETRSSQALTTLRARDGIPDWRDIEALIETCQALARDMLGCDRRTVRRYKDMVDTGYSTTLREGLAMESKASKEHMAGVSDEAIAARRAGIQDRGRNQQG